jgi:predicted metal-dependent peptidase
MSENETSENTEATEETTEEAAEATQETKEKKSNFDLDLHTYRLLQSEPFFAALSRRVNKSATNIIPTAGVKLNDGSGTFEMIYNPEFFERLTDVQKLGVLKHEFYHIIFEHVTGRLPPEGMSKTWNIATDLAINSFIPDELPEGGCIPTRGMFETYPLEMSAEWYYSKLQQDQQNEEGAYDPKHGQQGDGDGQGQGNGQPDSMDDHSGWAEADEDTKQMAKERMRQAVEDAVKEVQSRGQGWGTIGQSMQEKIVDMITPKVDWKKVLRYFIKTSQRSSKRSTVRRINPRYPYIHAGKKINRQAKIAIAIDQSGSVSDSMLAAFFSELNGLSKLAEFTVIPFDTQVDEEKVYVWKKGQRMAAERVLCGGTCFDAPTKYANKRGDFDGLIILTDMEAPKPVASKCQRIWFTSDYHAKNPYFATSEKVIGIPMENT